MNSFRHLLSSIFLLKFKNNSPFQGNFLAFLLLLVCLLFTVSSCSKKEKVLTFQERLDKELSERVIRLKAKKYAECHKRLLKQANQIADSTMIAKAKALKTTAVDKPPKPEKPEKPALISPKDSTNLEPLFEEEG